MLVNLLDYSVQLSVILIIVIGCLVTLCLLLYPAYFIINYLYKRVEVSAYFLTFLRYRKEFVRWYKETRPDVYSPKLKGKDDEE